ncbi:MAG: transcription-repair coupling factor [Candidatus Handelsmanbacteria bacterium]|nr:transcription-repair coupling factor [Candidatus Handelsmanbacteria bacterium]
MASAQSLDHLSRKTALTPAFREVVGRLQAGERKIFLQGLPDTLGAFLLVHAHRSLGRPLLVVAPDEDQAEQWRDDLQAIAGEEVVRYFPAWDVGLYDQRSPSPEITGLRLEAAARLLAGQPTIAVAPAAALVAPLIPPYALDLGTLRLESGQNRELDPVIAHLVDAGFERVPTVDGVGQFSVRGGILDVYPVGTEHPYRLEFFGERLESIRCFDLTTQRSLRPCQEALLLPAREVMLGCLFYGDYLQRLRQAEYQVQMQLSHLRDRLELGSSLEGIETWMAVLYGPGEGLFAYLKEPLVFCPAPEELEESLAVALAPSLKEYERHAARDQLLPPDLLVYRADWLEAQLARCPRLLPAPLGRGGEALNFGAQPCRVFQGELSLLRPEITRLGQEGYALHLMCETQGQRGRLQEIFAEDWIRFELGVLRQGFVYPAAQLALFNDHEIFSRQKRRYRYRRFKAAAPIPSAGTLQRGDFVVHVDHGIGRYLGIQRLDIGGRPHDCLSVAYLGADKLFVPVEQLDRLRKYSSDEGQTPLLNKLGSSAWEKLKERTREEIFKMAGELLQLYAERKALLGFAFSADTSLHRELEASFPFQETPDQLRTMEEVRQDMEAPHPMDRLVCGDVGYGKTEVAVRAAFKAVADHKQVAVLVPTTILAQQHYQTFGERMAHSSVNVEVLSRFRTAQQQKEVLEKLRQGQVDVLIGTHRLLSQDVRFRDLGLLVVDEEQRFGVKHKERLKQLKRQVDVLTLTATPIPRTLHMALMGSRDMSVINTPPQDRLPIHTEILPFDEQRIAAAILREVERHGQVYFVHNRVQSIHSLVDYLQELLPQVRFGVAHGQMPARQLEGIMHDFLDKKYDCLVCTMIIESGIDIPSVNTILVNRADALGLSQLYQIRGRVGRSKDRAFAYLLVPKGKKFNRKSLLRLRAIEEFADLGSGFNIAMRDMEIRGAGNLLGAQQHGFITAVGFDLYCRLLEEAMHELKGEAVESAVEPEIKIAATAYIPEDYVPDADQKMSFYQRLAGARRLVELLAIQEELEDRFGRMPFPTRSLLRLMEIKVMARQLGVGLVQLERARLRLVWPPEFQPARTDIQRLVEKSPAQLEFNLGEQFAIEAQVAGGDEQERLEGAKNILQEIL